MGQSQIHQQAVGITFTARIRDGLDPVDISGTNIRELVFVKPTGARMVKPATFTTDGVDGKMEWTTTTIDDLDESGTYQVQGWVKWADGTQFPTDIREEYVHKNL